MPIKANIVRRLKLSLFFIPLNASCKPNFR